MAKVYAAVSIFCFVSFFACFADAGVAPHGQIDQFETCFQSVASREDKFFVVAEKYGIISAENVVNDEKKPAYFKLMQAYSENLRAPADRFCEALVKAGEAASNKS